MFAGETERQKDRKTERERERESPSAQVPRPDLVVDVAGALVPGPPEREPRLEHAHRHELHEPRLREDPDPGQRVRHVRRLRTRECVRGRRDWRETEGQREKKGEAERLRERDSERDRERVCVCVDR